MVSPREDRGLRRLAFLVEYDGTAYHGSQWQQNAPSIQGTLERAAQRLTGQQVRIALAGRTDAGVHARGQVFSLMTNAPYEVETFVRALNSYLPPDIAVRAGAEVPQDFDVRRQARSRLYCYIIYNDSRRAPLWRHRAWHMSTSLDVDSMRAAASALVGRHDFASFTSADPRTGTVRTVMRAEIGSCKHLVSFRIEANAFLPRQVRRTVGALAQVGLGKLAVDEFRRLVEQPQPDVAGPAAPPWGLYLVKVNYGENLFGGKEYEDYDKDLYCFR